MALHILTADEVLQSGLTLLYTLQRIERTKSSQTNLERFKSQFGATPSLVCSLYEDMQQTDIAEAKVDGDKKSLKYLLITLHFLYKYPKYDDLEAKFDYSPGYIARKIWEMVGKIRAMKHEVIIFPDADEIGDDIWFMSVDGTHVWKKEPSHIEFSMDTSEFSHKYNKAASSYELGISLTGGLIWMNGPFPGGTNDITIFRSPGGLKEKLEELGKRAIGDRGYRGEPNLVSYPNALDSKAVDRFKSRALCRHETFNGMTKTFDILAGRFRHDESKFPLAFEAVCVLCQYKVENELPLYDVLIEAVVNADVDSDDDDSEGEEE